MDLTNLIVLVTGGGSGIGLELSRQLASLGNTVFICGRNLKKLEAAANEYGLHAVAGDITNGADQQRILEAVAQGHGRLDLLINNAGVFGAYDFARQGDAVARIEAEIAVNATAPLTLTKRALPLLSFSANPAVMFIGSGVAFVPVAGTPVYSGTKALLHHASKALRHQLKPAGISIFEALPPVIDTDMGRALKSKNLKVMRPEDLVAQILVGLQKDQFEMVFGQSKQLRLLSRLAPDFVFKAMAKTEFY